MKRLHLIVFTAASIFLLSCSSSSDDDDDETTTTTGDVAPTLAAADRPDVPPCPDQDILTDAAELADLKDALSTGALSFLDVPFDINDADNFKKKCGLEGFWDPAANVDEVTPAGVGMTEITLSQLLTNGNAGICTATSSPMNFITGFPVAGTYRAEIKAAKGGSTWHLRFRALASGTSAGNTFTAEGVTVPGDIETVLEYKVNGVVTAHADLRTAIADAASTSGDAILFEASKTAGGPVVFSASIELICVRRS